MYEVITSKAVIKNPGTKPARKSLGIDCSAIKPYMINKLLGGIILPKAPPAADTAPANLLVYPSRFITGIVILPIAAVVAGPEPDRAENNIQANTVIIPVLPR